MKYAIAHRNPGRSRGAQNVLFKDRAECLAFLARVLPDLGGKASDWQVVEVEHTSPES